MFEKLKTKRLSLIIRSINGNKVERRVASVCVFDTNFYTSRVEYEEKMQEIISYYAKIHESTGGRLNHEKVTMRRCQ